MTCVDCGLENSYSPIFYESYTNTNLYRRKRQYYSRAKRFSKILREMRSETIGASFDRILDLYSLLEFRWLMQSKKKRKYFFNSKVVLWTLLYVLDIDIDVPRLKNQDRGKVQLETIVKLLPEYIEQPSS